MRNKRAPVAGAQQEVRQKMNLWVAEVDPLRNVRCSEHFVGVLVVEHFQSAHCNSSCWSAAN